MDASLLIELIISVTHSNAILIAKISHLYIDILFARLLVISTFNTGIQKAAETWPSGVVEESVNTFV